MAANASLSKHRKEWVKINIAESGAYHRTLSGPIADPEGTAAAGAAPTYPGHLLGVTESYHPDNNGCHAKHQQLNKHDIQLG